MSSPAELVHYGVKGMKWGVRRADLNTPNARYSAANRAKDQKAHGDRGVKRINKRLNKGQTLTKARGREVTRNTALVTGTLAAATALKIAGPVLMQSISIRAEQNRNAAERQFRDGQSGNIGTSGRYGENGKLFTPNRKGVYNISTI